MRSDDRPSLTEQLAVAVGSSNLAEVEGRETQLDRIIALGLANRSLSAEAATKAQRIGADLTSQLLRARYGMDNVAYAVATEVFADWLCAALPYWEEIDSAVPGLAFSFSGRVLREWIKLRCRACGGGGKQQQVRGGKRVRPGELGLGRGAMVRCQECKGTGRMKISQQERRRAIEKSGLSVRADEYDKFWRRRFTEAFGWLQDLAVENRSHLRRLLDRDRVAPDPTTGCGQAGDKTRR